MKTFFDPRLNALLRNKWEKSGSFQWWENVLKCIKIRSSYFTIPRLETEAYEKSKLRKDRALKHKENQFNINFTGKLFYTWICIRIRIFEIDAFSISFAFVTKHHHQPIFLWKQNKNSFDGNLVNTAYNYWILKNFNLIYNPSILPKPIFTSALASSRSTTRFKSGQNIIFSKG